jgi:plasmid stabilization system protein ParE
MNLDAPSRLIVLAPGVASTPRAQNDVIEIAVYLGKINPRLVERFYQALAQTFMALTEMPHLGAPREFPDARLHNLRQWPVQNFKNYLIFYRSFASTNGLEILRILHAARDLSSSLQKTFD